MIEKDFKEIDNDFITMWCKKLLGEELFESEIEKLAEMGQLNAIQVYYGFFHKTVSSNNIIDENVCELKMKDFNYLLIKGLQLITNEKYEKFKELTKLYREILMSYLKIDDEIKYSLLSRFGVGKVIGLREKKFNKKVKLNSLRKEINDIEFAYYINESIIETREQFEKTRNMKLLATRYEIVSHFRFPEFIDDFNYELKVLKKYLIREYKNSKSVENAFVLAKHISNFGGTEKEKTWTNKMLKKLSQREYSKKFQNYQLKGKTHCMAEKKEKEL